MIVLSRVLSVVLGTMLVLVLWYKAAPVIVALLDFNLAAIKWVVAQVPAPYGAMAESALRIGLMADKAMVLAEGSWLMGSVLWLVRRAFGYR